jgi:hemerythrin superfamily protein
MKETRVDVLDLLKQDHQKVSALIQEVQDAEPDDERVRELAEQISQELTVHSALEEALFYPLLRDRAEEAEERVDVFEAFTEHDVVKHLISLLEGGRRTNDEVFKAELQVLGENVKHHVREEESTIFSLARELLDDEEREELAERVQAEKERLMSPGRSRGRKKTAAAKKSGARKTATARKASNGRKGAAGRKASTGRKAAGGRKASSGRKAATGRKGGRKGR